MALRLHPAVAAITALQLISAQAVAQPANASTTPASGVPALYPSKALAERAAKEHFQCSGAHPMGHQWMPCSSHPSPAHHSSSQH
jgi:hypothetical protein